MMLEENIVPICYIKNKVLFPRNNINNFLGFESVLISIR